MIMWGVLAAGWIFKFIGNLAGYSESGLLFAALSWMFKYSFLLTLPFTVMIFLGYNDLFKDGGTFTDKDKLNFLDLFLI